MSKQNKTIFDFIAALPPEQLAIVNALRGLATSSAPGVTEHIKWNAPSFVHDGEDRITLGSDKAGRIRVILHRGAKSKTPPGFSFAAPAALVTWAAPDRGVMTFASLAEVEAWQGDIAHLFRRWLEIK